METGGDGLAAEHDQSDSESENFELYECDACGDVQAVRAGRACPEHTCCLAIAVLSAPEEDELPPGCHFDADGNAYDGNVGSWHSDLPFDSVPDTLAYSDGHRSYLDEEVEFVC